MEILLGGLAVFYYLFFGLICALYWRPHENMFMAAFFVGEMLKLFISAILFLLIVKYLPVSLLSVLVGFAGAIIAFWIVCVRHFSQPVGVVKCQK